MAKTYQDIQRQIAKLQEDAQKARKAELSEVIRKVRHLVVEYGLEPSDVFGAGGRGRRAIAAPAPAARKSVGVAKYRDPKSGKTWTGRGKPPSWIAGKRDRTKFLIDEPPPGPVANGNGETNGQAATDGGGGHASTRGKRSGARVSRAPVSRKTTAQPAGKPSAKAEKSSPKAPPGKGRRAGGKRPRAGYRRHASTIRNRRQRDRRP